MRGLKSNTARSGLNGFGSTPPIPVECTHLSPRNARRNVPLLVLYGAAIIALTSFMSFGAALAQDEQPSSAAEGSQAQSAKSKALKMPPDVGFLWDSTNKVTVEAEELKAIRALHDPKAKIVIVGDSHAERFHAPLAKWGLANNYAVDLVKLGGGCPPLIDTYVFDTSPERDTKECNTEKRLALKAIGDKDFNTVIFVARWGMYTANYSSLDYRVQGKDITRTRSISQDPNKGYDGDLAKSRQAFTTGVRDTVKYFKSKGKRVVFVTQPPPLGLGPRPCIEKQATKADVVAKCFPITYDDQMTEIQWSTDTLAAMSKELGFELVNAHDAFCAESNCRKTGNEGVLYSDGDHLSYAGASILAEKVEPIISNMK